MGRLQTELSFGSPLSIYLFAGSNRIKSIGMKLCRIHLSEGQLEYLTKKYGQAVSADIINQAIALSPRLAEKLVYAYANKIIPAITQEVIPTVQNIDPFQKVKSPEALAYEQLITRAKQINVPYYQWVIKVWKTNPGQQFDPSWFHYLEAEHIDPKKLVDIPVEKVKKASERWHAKFAKLKNVNGYKLSINSPGSVQVARGFWIVPVLADDAKVEGQKMQNCIGTICRPTSTNLIFSLRDSVNEPHVSISIQNGMVSEIKGKQNKEPIAKYCLPTIEWLASFIAENKLGRASNSSDLNTTWLSAVGVDHTLVSKLQLFLPIFNSFLPVIKNTAKIIHNDNSALRTLTDTLIQALQPNTQRFGNNTLDAIMELCDTIGPILDIPTIMAFDKIPEFKTPILISAIKHKKISEQDVSQMSTDRTSLGFRLLIQASFHPEEFINTLQTYDPKDLINSVGFGAAIAAYNGPPHVVFTNFYEMPEAWPKVPIDILKQYRPHNGHEYELFMRTICDHDDLSLLDKFIIIIDSLKNVNVNNWLYSYTDTSNILMQLVFLMEVADIPKAITAARSDAQLNSESKGTACINDVFNRAQSYYSMISGQVNTTDNDLADWLMYADTDADDIPQLAAMQASEEPQLMRIAALKLAALEEIQL